MPRACPPSHFCGSYTWYVPLLTLNNSGKSHVCLNWKQTRSKQIRHDKDQFAQRANTGQHWSCTAFSDTWKLGNMFFQWIYPILRCYPISSTSFVIFWVFGRGDCPSGDLVGTASQVSLSPSRSEGLIDWSLDLLTLHSTWQEDNSDISYTYIYIYISYSPCMEYWIFSEFILINTYIHLKRPEYHTWSVWECQKWQWQSITILISEGGFCSWFCLLAENSYEKRTTCGIREHTHILHIRWFHIVSSYFTYFPRHWYPLVN